MIIPTPEFDPLFADDGVPFRIKMIQFIEHAFGDILEDRQGLLRSESGLDTLANIVACQLQSSSSTSAA